MAHGPASSALPTRAERLRSRGRIAGLLFCFAGLGSLPASALLRDGDLPPYGLTALLSGLVCLVIPWNRIAGWWLNVVPPLAALQLALAVRYEGTHGEVFAAYWFLIVAFVAYAFTDRRVIAAHLALVLAAAGSPVLDAGTLRSDQAVSSLVTVPTMLAVALLIVILRERLERGQRALASLAARDPLTDLANHRTLRGRLEYEVARHARSGRPLALLTLDLDGFKAVNDREGHLAGDRLLRAVADGLRATVRAQDTAARQGGDEFALVAPETDGEDAAVLAARVREAVAAAGAAASIGWAVYPDDADGAEALMAAADARERASKAAGRVAATSSG